MSVKFTSPSSVTVTGTTYENEPIIKSDGAGDVMQWLSNDESSNITISEDAANKLNLHTDGTVYLGGTTDDDNKYSRIISNQWDAGAEAEGYVVVAGFAGSSLNRVDIGGGTSSHNAATSIDFYTGGNVSTRTGTKRLTIDSAGNVGVGTSSPNTYGYGTAVVLTISDPTDHANNRGILELESTKTTPADGDYLGGIAFISKNNTNGKRCANILARASGSTSAHFGGKLEFQTKADNGAEATALTIDSTGKLILGLTDAYICTGTDNGSDNKSILLDSGDGGSSRGAYVRVCGNQHASEGGKLVLQTGNSAESANAGVYVLKDGGYESVVAPATGGIYEVGGVLKENLLTNSGFDVWSNSTLEDVTGTNLVSAWTNHGSYSYDVLLPDTDTNGTTDGVAITQAVKSTSSGADIAYSAITTTEGKLYEISFTCTLASGTLPSVYVASTQTGIAGAVAQRAVAGAQTICFEAASDSDYIMFRMEGAETTDYAISSFTLYEVTPGFATGTNGPDGWKQEAASNYGATQRQHEHATYTKDGSFYSLKFTSHATTGTGGSGEIYQVPWVGGSGTPGNAKAEILARVAGRTMTFGAWVYSTGAVATLYISDSERGYSTAQHDVSQTHTAGTGWEWLEITHTFGASPAQSVFGLYVDGGSNVVYMSHPMLVFGSAIGEGNYSRPSGEIVNCEAAVRVVNGTSPVAADDEILNLEALSSGKIPKGAKAVFLRTLLSNTSIVSAQGVKITATSGGTPQLDNYPMVDNVRSSVSGRVGCDSNGDVYQEFTALTGTLSGYYLDVTTVELR